MAFAYGPLGAPAKPMESPQLSPGIIRTKCSRPLLKTSLVWGLGQSSASNNVEQQHTMKTWAIQTNQFECVNPIGVFLYPLAYLRGHSGGNTRITKCRKSVNIERRSGAVIRQVNWPVPEKRSYRNVAFRIR